MKTTRIIPTKVPTIADLDNDGINEVIFGTLDGRLYVLNNDGEPIDSEAFQKQAKLIPSIYGIAVEDVNLDGVKEILFTDHYWKDNGDPMAGLTTQSYMYAYNLTKGNLMLIWKTPIQGGEYTQGSQDFPSLSMRMKSMKQ